MKANKKILIPGWEICQINDIGIVVTGNTPSTKKGEYYGGNVPFYKPTDLNAGSYVDFSSNYLSNEGADQARLLPANSVLVTCIGATIGKTGLIKKKGAFNQQINGVRNFLTLSKFIYYQVISSEFQKQIVDNSSSTTLPILNKSKFERLPFRLPPLNEQHRIVEKIEELFSELDNGIANLKLAQQQLKVYRQSLLKAAFEGKLTEKWRKEHQPEPAEKLLERIKVERQERYEREIEEWKATVKEWEKGGKEGKKPKKPSSLILPADLDSKELKDLYSFEKFATWTKVGVVSKIEMGQSPPGTSYNDKDQGVPLINGPVEFGDTPFSKTIKSKWTTKPTKMCQEGDLILCVRGSTTGRQNIAGFDACIGRGVCAIREQGISQDFLIHYFNSVRRKVYGMGTGTTFPSVSKEQLNELPIPLFSITEQEVIVETLEYQFSIIDNMESTIENELQKAELNRQSILKKAFEGKLVAQNPKDEQASGLLERIKEEKAKYLAEQKKAKKTRKKKVRKMTQRPSVEEVLKAAKKPMRAEMVWKESEHYDDIEKFYASLKALGDKLVETKTVDGAELSLKQ